MPELTAHAELCRLLTRAEALARGLDDPALNILLRRAIIRVTLCSAHGRHH